MKIFKFVFLFTFLLLGFSSFAQRPEVFPEDSTGFFKEMEDYFRSTKKPEARKFMKEFEDVWFGGFFIDEERAKVYEVCNKMNDKRMLPFPEFYNYLNTIMRYKYSGKPYSQFVKFHESVDPLIDGRNKRLYVEFLKFCSNLFESNALYKTGTATWKADNPDFIISRENDEPVIYWPSLNLYCLAKKDSAIIHETSGKYYPMKDLWVGNRGKVDYRRAGFDANEVYALFDKYKIDMRHPYYSVDTVLFHNPQYFGDATIKGSFEEKVLANVTEETARYPRFTSFNKRLKIKNLDPNVDFDGGFSQQGSKFLGKGTAEEKAELIFYKDDMPFIRVKTQNFAIREDRITAQRAEIVMYLEQDSIYHPGVKFQFLRKERLLSLTRTGEDITKAPYINTFHMVDMRFEVMYWKIDDPIITMEALFGSTIRDGLFESLEFFKESRYDDLYRIDDVHPLLKVKRVAQELGRDEFNVKEAAELMRISVSNARVVFLELSNFGYVSYNFESGDIQVKEKLYNYVLAKSKKIDYDVLQFSSKPDKGINAKLNLLNYDMSIEGLDLVLLSDSHLVYIYPEGRKINLKKNRDFEFDGIVNAGNFEIFGKENYFSYDNFKFDLPKVDSLRIYVETDEVDERGLKKQQRVKTVIEGIKGDLEIDSPGNKSGLKPLKRWPVFTSKQKSYAYYDAPSVQGGVYKRDSFYFQLEPFTIDSVDNFDNKSLRFEGTFASAGIFPEFKETLLLQEDYSLGFTRPTPPEGYEVYGGKGKFFQQINLSHDGLKGDGYLEYLTSTTESKNLYFHPDSVFGMAENYIIEEQFDEVQYPPVTGTDVFVKWHPRKDYMTLATKETPMKFYDGESKFSGKINYSPKELRGGGKYEFREATLYSKDYLFKFIDFYSDTADFRLNSLLDNSLTFNTSNLNAHVDFKERKALFISNGGSTTINLPENQYIARMDRFTWYMDSEEIELSGGEVTEAAARKELDLEGSKFTSVHPDQDSLNFYSSAAKYNYNTKIIDAFKVQLVQVGDAFVYPDSSHLVIRAAAKMDPLKNAVIKANTITEYHNIYDADLNIKGRLNYTGTGKIDYVDEEKNKQIIELNKIYLDTTYQTIGVGEIKKEEGFTLSPNYQYYGDVRLEAAKPLLNFSGYSKIFHTCSEMPLEWFAFTADVDPEEIFLPIDSITPSTSRSNLLAGINLTTEPYELYSTFLNEAQKPPDHSVFNSTGFLYYDKPAETYIVSNLQKITQRSLPGNYLSLNKNSCAVFGEGKIRLGADLGRVENYPAGQITNYTTGDSTMIEMVWLVDFYMDNKAMKIMSDQIKEQKDLDRVDFDRNTYKRGVQELLGQEETDRIISELTTYQKFRRFPNGLEKAIFFSDINFMWNNETESFISVGPIGIGNILKEEINAYVNGVVEVVKKRSSDEISIYLEIDSRNWYFFNYRAEIMQAVSSNDEFNTAVKEAKKNKLEREKGKARYKYLMGSEAKKIQFLKKINAD